MKTLQWIVLTFMALGIIPANAQKTINDPNAELRNVGSFNAISVSSAIDVMLSQSEQTAVAVSAADAQIRSHIITEVKNGTLIINYKSSGPESWGSNKRMKAYIAVPMLDKITASGACNIIIDQQFNASNLEVNMSGASDFKGKLNAENLKLIASGSSDFLVSGKTTNLKIDLSGASDIKGYELESDFCQVVSSGASDVQISVNKELSVNASGASSVNYKGSGTVRESSVSGASSVKKKS
jgi:hypothetical protein